MALLEPCSHKDLIMVSLALIPMLKDKNEELSVKSFINTGEELLGTRLGVFTNESRDPDHSWIKNLKNTKGELVPTLAGRHYVKSKGHFKAESSLSKLSVGGFKDHHSIYFVGGKRDESRLVLFAEKGMVTISRKGETDTDSVITIEELSKLLVESRVHRTPQTTRVSIPPRSVVVTTTTAPSTNQQRTQQGDSPNHNEATQVPAKRAEPFRMLDSLLATRPDIKTNGFFASQNGNATKKGYPNISLTYGEKTNVSLLRDYWRERRPNLWDTNAMALGIEGTTEYSDCMGMQEYSAGHALIERTSEVYAVLYEKYGLIPIKKREFAINLQNTVHKVAPEIKRVVGEETKDYGVVLGKPDALLYCPEDGSYAIAEFKTNNKEKAEDGELDAKKSKSKSEKSEAKLKRFALRVETLIQLHYYAYVIQKWSEEEFASGRVKEVIKIHPRVFVIAASQKNGVLIAESLPYQPNLWLNNKNDDGSTFLPLEKLRHPILDNSLDITKL